MAANEELNQLSTTDASNTPAGSDVIGATLDNELRSIKANIARSAREESTATASAAATLAVTVLNKIVPVSGSAGGSTTITLPAAATAGAGFRFTAWKTDNTNNVVIQPDGAETVNGAANYTLATQYEAAQFVTDGTSWIVESTAKRELGTSDLADDSVTNAKLANMAQDRIKGRVTAGTGDPEDLTASQVRTMLSVYDQSTSDSRYVNVSGDTMTGDLDVNGTITSDGADLDGAVTINEAGASVDFRVESVNNEYMLFVDASTDRLGIGTVGPDGVLDVRASSSGTKVQDDGKVVIQRGAGADVLQLVDCGAASETAANPYLAFFHASVFGGSPSRMGYLGYVSIYNKDLYARNEAPGGLISLSTQKSDDSGGVYGIEVGPTAVVVNQDGHGVDFRVESSGNTHALFVQGSDGRVGINTATPLSPLEIGVASGASGTTSAFRITTADGGGWGVYPASAVANPVWITGCNSGEIQAWYVGGAEKMRLANGLQLGSPTGGDKGTGTLNATAVYDDNTLLTDFVLDQAVDGEIDFDFYDSLELGGKAAREWDARNLDIDHYEAQWRERKALPSFRSKAERFDSEGKEIRDSVGTLIQGLQQELETAMVHIAQLNARIKQLEEK